MLSFASDYIAGAHPRILEQLMKTNMEPTSGYGTDSYCASATAKIREACQCPQAEVYYLMGGTQTNQVVIDTMLAAYEGVIAATSGHVAVHEAGAIEYSGHKVLTLPATDGKISASDLQKYLENWAADGNHDHMVFPGMVYISFPSEYGTLYTKKELTAIHEICLAYKLPLYIDGARLGYALASPDCDLTLPELASLCEVFYIGGTKVGALCGEAVVFPQRNAPKHFITSIKQHGALLAKGRLLGVQFDTLFTDGLYQEISDHAIRMAQDMIALFKSKGYPFYLESPTNQQFLILENAQMERLAKAVDFSFWESYDATHTIVRFATSWSTTKEDLEALERLL